MGKHWQKRKKGRKKRHRPAIIVYTPLSIQFIIKTSLLGGSTELQRTFSKCLDFNENWWVWNLVSDIKEGPQTAGVWEQGAEENIWT
jgi:hypothetical protein